MIRRKSRLAVKLPTGEKLPDGKSPIFWRMIYAEMKRESRVRISMI